MVCFFSMLFDIMKGSSDGKRFFSFFFHNGMKLRLWNATPSGPKCAGSLSTRRGTTSVFEYSARRKNDGYQLLMGGKQDCCCIHHSLNQPHSVFIVWTSYRHHHNWWPKLLTRGFVYVSRVTTALAPEAASFYIRHQWQFCLVLSPTATLIIIIITTQMLAEVHHDSWDSICVFSSQPIPVPHRGSMCLLFMGQRLHHTWLEAPSSRLPVQSSLCHEADQQNQDR